MIRLRDLNYLKFSSKLAGKNQRIGVGVGVGRVAERERVKVNVSENRQHLRYLFCFFSHRLLKSWVFLAS